MTLQKVGCEQCTFQESLEGMHVMDFLKDNRNQTQTCNWETPLFVCVHNPCTHTVQTDTRHGCRSHTTPLPVKKYKHTTSHGSNPQGLPTYVRIHWPGSDWARSDPDGGTAVLVWRRMRWGGESSGCAAKRIED